MPAGALHYEVDGEGEPLVFIHGLGTTSDVWFAQREVLSKQFRVIVYDRSGCGLSALSGDGYSIEAWSDELAGLLDHLGVASAVVVGHSLGSTVALHFAARHPDRTRALVLAGGEAALTQEGKEILSERADLIEAHGLTAVADSWLGSVLSPATRIGNPTLAGLLRAMFVSNDARAYAQQAGALRDADVRPAQSDIACPTIVIVGDQDSVTPLSWQRAIKAAIPGSRLRIIPGTGHMTMLESPTAFNVARLEFLAGLGEADDGQS